MFGRAGWVSSKMTPGSTGLLRTLGLLWILVVSQAPAAVAAQQIATRPINVFVINDRQNHVANVSVTNALRDLKVKSPNKIGKVYVSSVNINNATRTLDSICSVWKSALKEDELNIPDFVLDTTTYGMGAETVNRFTALLGIPTLSAQFGQEDDLLGWRDISDEQKHYLVQVMNPADLIPEVIRQQCYMFNITNAAILFDENFVMDHKYKSLLLNVPTRHMIVRIKEPGRRLQLQLQMLREFDIVNFFILGSDDVISAALQAGSNLKYVGRKYGWFVVTLEEEPRISCGNCSDMSYMLFRPQSLPNQRQLNDLKSKGTLVQPVLSSAFYYDLAQIGVLAMKSALDTGMWQRPRFLDCDEYNENVTLPERNIDFLGKLRNVSNFQPISGGFVWGKNGESQAKFNVNVDLIDVIDSKLTSQGSIETWQAGIDVPLQVNDEAKAYNNTAITSYRVVTLIKPPFVMYDNVTDTWSGYCIELLDKIRDAGPYFEYEIREVEDKQYGAMDEDGNWNGMVKELKDKKADIALGAVTVMAERETVIDYTVPYYDLVGISIMRKKIKTSTSLFKFLEVLDLDVWLCIFGAYLFTSFLMWFFDKYSPYSYQNNREKYKDDDEKREFNLKECLWFCMTSLTPQGGGEAPKNLSGRLVAATWWLFGFIIIASYTANLAAFLTVTRLETPVESLEDLSKQYKIQYAPIANSSEYQYFERMAEIEKKFYEIWKDMSLNDSLSDYERSKLAVWDYPVSDRYTKMFQTMQDVGFPKDIDEALARVRSSEPSEFAFIGDATDIKYLVMTNCDFVQIGDEFSRRPYAIGVQQGSPLKDQFNNAILTMLNKRDLEKLKDRWWSRSSHKERCDRESEQSDGISIHNIGGVFLVIFVGIALACITLTLEYFYFRNKSKKGYHKKATQAFREKRVQRVQNKDIPFRSPEQIKTMKLNLRPAPIPAIPSSRF